MKKSLPHTQSHSLTNPKPDTKEDTKHAKKHVKINIPEIEKFWNNPINEWHDKKLMNLVMDFGGANEKEFRTRFPTAANFLYFVYFNDVW